MKPSRRVMMSIGSAFALLAAAVALTACGPPPSNILGVSTQPKTIQQLEKVEVRNYKGKRLDSIASLQENSIKGPQHVDLATYRLKVYGAGITTPAAFTYSQVTGLTNYRKVVNLVCVEGWNADLLWQGVKLTDIFQKAGMSASETAALPEGKRPVTVIFHCADGYTTSLPLTFVAGRKILLAYKENGVNLPERYGFPFQVVAEQQFGYKWAKWVTGIELSSDPNYRGYWEQRGYPNNAPVPK